MSMPLARWAVALALLPLALAGCGGASQAIVRATATPTASPTPAATATPAPMFSDPLTTDTHQWPIIASHCEFAHGGYQVTSGLCTVNNQLVDDGKIVVDVVVTAGSPDQVFSGLLWRATKGHTYEFGVAADGGWLFVKSILGSSPAIVDSAGSSVINQGLNVKNTLAVSFHGSHFVFFINGVQVGEEDDTSVTGLGGIGVTVGHYGTAVFNNFAYFA